MKQKNFDYLQRSLVFLLRFVLFSGSSIENTAWSGEQSELYTEVEEDEENLKNRPSYVEQENENPLYKTTGDDTTLNPIYERFVCLFVIFPESNH